MDKGLPVWIYALFLAGCNLTTTVFSVRIVKFGLSNGAISEKGHNVSMTCDFEMSSSDGIQTINVLKGEDRLASCTLYEGGNLPCSKISGVSARYTFTNSQPSVIITITDLQVSDGGNWYCGFLTTGNTLYNLIVYSSPTGLMLNGSSQPIDLSVGGAVLICTTTNCVYPTPGYFQWFYKEAHAETWHFYTNSSIASIHSACSGNEKVYSSTLSLVTNTVWPLQPTNADITVKFQCRLDFPTFTSPLRSPESTDVRYAVMVTSVTLKVEDRVASNSSTVVSGTGTRFSCVTSTSRPPATIVWYIESTVQQKNKSSEFTYIARYAVNGKHIYCKAFNIQKEESAVSSKTISLRVFEKARISTFLATGFTEDIVTVNKTDSVQIECTVESDPSSTIEIKFKDTILKSEENTRKLIYHLEDTTCLDTGVYTCSTRNEYNYGKDSEKELKINIRCSPRPLDSVKLNYTPHLHSEVTLTFTTLAYPEPGKRGFTWYRKNLFAWTRLLGNTHLHIQSSGQKSTLTIQNVTRSDYGYYRVTATNDVGTYDQYMELLEKGETPTTVVTKQTRNNSTLIVGVVLGLLIVALLPYSIIVTIMLKRKSHSMDEPRRSLDKSKTQTTYRNESYVQDKQEQRGSDSAHYYTNTTSGDNDKSMQEYTDLVRCTTDDQKTYDVIQKTYDVIQKT